ncbi:MAG: hypothetical protein ACJA17_000694, partial [Polaribacter sp.]
LFSAICISAVRKIKNSAYTRHAVLFFGADARGI